MLEYRVLLPEQVKPTYEQVVNYLPDRYRSLEVFIQLYFRKDTMMFEIGDFAGAFWLTDIIPGWRATIHIVTWDPLAADQATRAKAVLRELCRLFRFKKLSAYIPTTFEAAAKFADKVGFTIEGVEKYMDYYDGQLVDCMLCAYYKEEN